MITMAVITPNAISGVFANLKRFFHQFDLLEGPLVFRPLGRDNPVGGIDRASRQAVGDPLIDWLGSKGWPLVLGMSLLAANPSPGLFPPPFFLGFDNVTGGRFPVPAGAGAAGRKTTPYLRSLAEDGAEVRPQRIDPHGLDRQRLRKGAIIASPALGLTDTHPVGRGVRTPPKAVGFNERFGQGQILAIDCLPIGPQPAQQIPAGNLAVATVGLAPVPEFAQPVRQMAASPSALRQNELANQRQVGGLNHPPPYDKILVHGPGPYRASRRDVRNILRP